MTLKELKAKKIELGLTTEMIANASGVPKSTVEKIFGGTTKAPRKATLEAIERVLAAEAAKRPFVYVDPKYLAHSNILRESSAAFGKAPKKKYTIDDYYALPDDQRMELIDGG